MPECPSCSYIGDREHDLRNHYDEEHEELAKEIAICSTEGCNNIFSYYPSSKEGKFCKKCTKNKNYHLTENKISYFDVICEHCEDSFEVTESRYQNHKKHFCDKSCKNAYYRSRGKIECKNCGTERMIQSWKIRHGQEYCDRRCYIEDNQPDDSDFSHDYYGISFEEVREKVRVRDNGECQVCGKGKDVLGKYPSAHHITPVAWFIDNNNFVKDDANYTENLVLLCPHHHSKADFGKISLEEELDDELLEELELEAPVKS